MDNGQYGISLRSQHRRNIGQAQDDWSPEAREAAAEARKGSSPLPEKSDRKSHAQQEREEESHMSMGELYAARKKRRAERQSLRKDPGFRRKV